MKVERLHEALEGSGWTVDQVLDGVERGDFYLFQNDGAVAVVEFIISPRHKVGHVWAAGGDLQSYLELVPIMEAFSISNGCDIAGGTGRVGWVRAMKSMGYSASPAAIEKEL